MVRLREVPVSEIQLLLMKDISVSLIEIFIQDLSRTLRPLNVIVLLITSLDRTLMLSIWLFYVKHCTRHGHFLVAGTYN